MMDDNVNHETQKMVKIAVNTIIIINIIMVSIK